jgi:hypothetical protein
VSLPPAERGRPSCSDATAGHPSARPDVRPLPRFRRDPGGLLTRRQLNGNQWRKPCSASTSCGGRRRWRSPFRGRRASARPGEAVVAIDATLASRLITKADLTRFAAGRPYWPGGGQLHRVLFASDACSGSPMESRLRLLLVAGGLPWPVTQYEVRTAEGLFVAWLDLAYPEHKLGIEYEGDHHGGRGCSSTTSGGSTCCRPTAGRCSGSERRTSTASRGGSSRSSAAPWPCECAGDLHE